MKHVQRKKAHSQRKKKDQVHDELSLANLDDESDSSSSYLSETSDEDFNPEPHRFGYQPLKDVNKFKIVTTEDIDILTKEYRSDIYNFNTVGSAFCKRMNE